MNWRKLLAKLKEVSPETASALEDHFGALEEENGKIKTLETENIKLTTQLEERHGKSSQAVEDLKTERTKREEAEGMLETLKKKGVLDAEGKIQLDLEKLGDTETLTTQITDLTSMVDEYKEKEAQVKRDGFLVKFVEDKKVTSGIRILKEVLDKHKAELEMTQEAFDKVLEEALKDYGEEMFAIPKKAGEGEGPDPDDPSNPNPNPNPNPNLNPGQTTPKEVGAGYKVNRAKPGDKVNIQIDAGRPGHVIEEAPTTSQLIQKTMQANNIPVPAVISAQADKADDERKGRQAKVIPTGASHVAASKQPDARS